MLREDTNARFESGFLRRRLVSGRREFEFISSMAHRAILAEQRTVPVAVAEDERRTWWMFRDRFFWEDDGLGPDEVAALVHERERRLRQAHRAGAGPDGGRRRGGRPAPRGRSPRTCGGRSSAATGGAASACGSAELLQFDHVIPVALGRGVHAGEPPGVCAPCNRAKGASLS